MTTVGDLMTGKVVTLHATDDLVHADALMNLERIRHLPVVEGKRLLGLVTHRDILRTQARIVSGLESKDETELVSLTAKDLMTENVRTTTPDTPAKTAARALLDNRFGCLPVLDGDALVGIVTEVDFLRWSLDQLD